MIWLAAIVFLIALAWFVVNFEDGCAIVIGTIVLIVVAVVLLFAFLHFDNEHKNEERRKISERIIPEILLIDSNFQPTDRHNSYYFTSKVKNNSKYNVTRLKFRFIIKDCIPSNDSNEQAVCNVIGDHELNEYINIPAGQVRSVGDHVEFIDMPPIEGDWIVEYSVKFVYVE